MKELLFVYGTLNDPKVQKEVLGREIAGQTDSLAGFKKEEITIDSETYPILVPEENSLVEGRALELTSGQLTKVDDYETTAYRRIRVKLQSGRDACVYVK